jgi:adenosylcobinamide-GDP ribazoletransferase
VAALRWLPVVGAVVGALAGLPLAAVRQWAGHATALGAVLAVVALVLGTRALHLDGLADTADGLGSRAPAERAREIMRRSDVGPFGVVAVVLVLIVDVTALAALGGGSWRPVAALAVAAATGRVAVLAAAHRRVRPARADGFGAYVASSTSTPFVAGAVSAVVAFGVGMAAATGADLLGWALAQLAGLGVALALCAHAVRRLDGVTGDVFGALIEIGTAATLAGLAFT